MEKHQSLKILCIEDDPSLGRILRKSLKRNGFTPTLFTSGEAAIDALARNTCDVIVLDYELPGMSGIDVLRILFESHANIPVVMVTGQGNEGIAVEAMKLGASDYVVKDIDATYLELLPSVLERTYQHQRLKKDKIRADLKLRESEERYREKTVMLDNILRSANDTAIATTDLDFRITYYNPAAKKFFGYSVEEVIGKTVMEIHTKENVQPERFEHAIEVVRREGEFSCSMEQETEDGPRILDSRISGIIDPEGALVGFSLFSKDVTKRKQDEKERLSLERQVQHAQKLESLGVLAGGIAHDFNNILMAILGNADLALHELSPHAPGRDNIQEIEKASRRAAELAKQMLAYSGKGHFVIGSIELNELVEEMGHLLEISISKKVVLKYNFADSLPLFYGDAAQARQIIMNLITNASEAIGDKSGVIALSTSAMDCDRAYLNSINETLQAGLKDPLPEGIYTCLEVADTGCGMDAEIIGKIFDPFFTTKFTGRGLGMAAVLGIVSGHKGAIKIFSEVGKGSTLKVLFPANEIQGSENMDRDKESAKERGWLGSGTILIADDEETVCAVEKQMLKLLGFDVLTAFDGQEAVDVFREHTDEIACVLLDLTMPRMDGEQAFREIRRIQPDAKVILCSGYNEQDATERFTGKGLAGFIQKPGSMATFRKLLKEIL